MLHYFFFRADGFLIPTHRLSVVDEIVEKEVEQLELHLSYFPEERPFTQMTKDATTLLDYSTIKHELGGVGVLWLWEQLGRPEPK